MGEEACCPPVVVVLEPLLDGAEVHRLLDDLEVVRQAQLLHRICLLMFYFYLILWIC